MITFVHFYGNQFSYHPLDEPILLWTSSFNSTWLNPSSYGLVTLIQLVVEPVHFMDFITLIQCMVEFVHFMDFIILIQRLVEPVHFLGKSVYFRLNFRSPFMG